MAHAFDNILDAVKNRLDHFIGIALNFKSQRGIVRDHAVLEPSRCFADNHPRTGFLGQTQLHDLIDDFIDYQDGIGFELMLESADR